MKRKFEHPKPSARELAGPKYWRSLEELAETPGFKAQLAREFPEGASSLDGVDRRQFVKIMAASFALGGVGLAGCRRPEEHILPFGKSIEGSVPGLPIYYATAMPLRRTAIPLLAETHQGRPTKIEGNPTYAPHGGSSSLLAQASVLDLYDPDRAQAHTQGGATLDGAAVRARLAAIGADHAATGGSQLAFLAESSSSPTRARLLAKLKDRFPKAIWAEYEPVTDEPPLSAAQAVFGRSLKPIYRFGQATRIVSLDCDFLSAEAGSLYYARDFTRGRKVTSRDDTMNRLYAAESNLTLTGSMADHRLRIASSHMLALAAALASKITGDPSFAAMAEGLDVDPAWISECAADLSSNKGSSLVVAGAHLPAEIHAVAYAINAALGNLGRTVEFVEVTAPAAPSISDLATAVKSGSVRTLVILGGNPAYNAPVDLDWPSLQKSVSEVVRFGYYVDETSALAGTHVASAHFLESWGDARTFDGTVVPIQPMILPLFGGLTEIEVLALIAGETDTDPHSLVRQTLASLVSGDLDQAFTRFLHDGLLADSAWPTVSVDFDGTGMSRLVAGAGKAGAFSLSNLEVRFVADHKLDDGRYSNNGWLQECPDPMTKLAWDNAILISPRLAKELGIEPKASLLQVARKDEQDFDLGRESAHVAVLTIGGRQVRAPLHIQIGLSNYTVVVPLGYGRAATGRIGSGVGFNAYAIRTSTEPHVAAGGTLELTGERRIMADTQWHWSMEGRELVREANYDEYQNDPGWVKEVGMESETPPVYGEDGDQLTLAEKVADNPRGNSLYKNPKEDGVHQWGMSIDLNTCIGCNACVVACQSENNIPIVGRDQVIRGRVMHWIRIDRYYSDGKADGAAFGGPGNRELPEDAQVSLQPVACMQCELAPCEMVCPVNATVHDDEGINVMAYNRCIGTRYCANNCPYKVRRFNYFDWNRRSIDDLYMGPLGPKGPPELVQMAKNPEVTVRMRGVMEKCTYCIQRIENGKIHWKVKMAQAGTPGNVAVPDGVIRTACQQACPVSAIEFGNLLDENSAVSKAKAREQDYGLLSYLNTRPRTTYLARIRNPNPRMPDYNQLPLSRVEHNRKSHPQGLGGSA
jgi:molybdopterin-containing oxidoreductase family iron-sulfur binding subunit